VIHAITPGDHYSPLTGSAIPTVVDGIARAAAPGGRHAVLVGSDTYADRYDSAAALEHRPTSEPAPVDRRKDVLDGLVRARRPRAAAALAPMLRDQDRWEPSALLAHNLVELVPLVDASRHRPVLYAHNELLRTYTQRDAGRALDQVELVVCVSQFLAGLTQARLPRRLRDRVSPVHNGVDCERFHPAVRAPEQAGLRVVFVGRVVPNKGAHVLLEAVNRLGRRDVIVSVIGSAGFAPDAPLTAYERRLREIAGRGIATVTFLPFRRRDEVASALRAHDVLVVPSRWREPSTLTVGEGLATGIPVIASDVGGIPEVAAHRELLVRPGDPDALAAVLAWLADDPSARERLGRESRAHAVAHDWGATWARLSALLGR
jgi:glycosyltransferase involved in cell wall biosynthesis